MNARLVQAGFLLAALLAWWAATAAGLVAPLFLPAPGAVARAFLRVVAARGFTADLATTFASVALAWVIAVGCGLLVGALIGRARFAREVIEPLLSGMFAVPLIIFYPLVLFMLGIGVASKIAFAAFYGFFPVALHTIAAFATVEARFVLYAVTLGASRMALFRRVLLPAAMPEIVAGLRVSFVVTASSVVAGEMISSITGLGHQITFLAETLEPASMFAYIALVILATVAVNAMLSRLGRR